MDVSAAAAANHPAVLCSGHPSACCRTRSLNCAWLRRQGAGGWYVLHRGEGLRRLCGDVLCDPHRAGGCVRRRRLDSHRLLGYHLIQPGGRGGRVPAAHVRTPASPATPCCLLHPAPAPRGLLLLWRRSDRLTGCVARRCDWVISCPDPETHVHLTFDEFNISPEQATPQPNPEGSVSPWADEQRAVCAGDGW